MNQLGKWMGILGLGLLLSACATQNPMDSHEDGDSENGPATISGTIHPNGTYQNKVGYGWGPTFTVSIPQARDAYEFSHTWRNDELKFGEARATFGPAALDGTVYRVWVGKKGASLESFKLEKLAEAIEEAKTANGQFDLTPVASKEMTINGHRALFGFYSQVILDTANELLPYYNKGLYSHAFYFIDEGDYAAMLWVQATTGGGVNAIDKLGQKTMIEGTFEPQTYFVNSFSMKQ